MTSHVKRWTHSLTCQLKGDAEDTELYLLLLNAVGDISLVSTYTGLDSDTGIYELIFYTVEKIEDSVIHDILGQVRCMHHNFNIGEQA